MDDLVLINRQTLDRAYKTYFDTVNTSIPQLLMKIYHINGNEFDQMTLTSGDVIQIPCQFNFLEMPSNNPLPITSKDSVNEVKEYYDMKRDEESKMILGEKYEKNRYKFSSLFAECTQKRIEAQPLTSLSLDLGVVENGFLFPKNMIGVDSNTIIENINLGLQRCVLSNDRGQLIDLIFAPIPNVNSTFRISVNEWESLAKAILIANYRYTLIHAVTHLSPGKRCKVFLIDPDEVFGINYSWIYEAIEKACNRIGQYPLDIYIVYDKREIGYSPFKEEQMKRGIKI